MSKTDLPYLLEDTDRHGNRRIYVRKLGLPRIRLRAAKGTPEFHLEYLAALEINANGGVDDRAVAPGQINRARPASGTFRALCVAYLTQCLEFKRLDPSTARVRRRIIDSMLAEPRVPGASELFSDCPVTSMTPRAIKLLRDRKRDTPGAANERVKTLRGIFAWAVEAEFPGIKENPARDLGKIKYAATGHHSWRLEEVEQFEQHWAIGTKARLALSLLLFTGQRRSDVVLFGRQHVREGWLRFTQQKNRNRNPTKLELPVLPELQAVIDASPCGDLTFLLNEFGKPYGVGGLSHKMRGWCDAAGLPHCTAHGLRKAGATRAAEAGATVYQLMAIFGWKNADEAAYYVRAADQKKLASQAMSMLGKPNE